METEQRHETQQRYATEKPPETEKRHRSVVGPIVLVLVGLFLLLSNLGVVDWNIWQMIWKLWPLWLIAIGAEMMLGRRTSWGSWAVIGIVIAVASGAVALSSFGLTAGGEPTTTSVRESLGDAKRAKIEIHSGVTELQVSDDTDVSTLASGQLTEFPNERIEKSVFMSGDTAQMTLRSRSKSGTIPFIRSGYNGHSVWDLKLTKQVPMTLVVHTGVGKSELDLSKLQVTDAEVHTGVGETTLTVPAQGESKVKVESGVGKLTVYIPKGVAYYVKSSQGIGTVEIQGTYERRDGAYISPNYETASNKVTLNVSGGIGKIDIAER